MLKYLSEVPVRDNGMFDQAIQNQEVNQIVKPLPEIQWDSEVTYTRQVFDLRKVVLANFTKMSGQKAEDEDTDDTNLIVELVFSPYQLDTFAIQEAEVRSVQETITFNLEFDDLQDFLEEIKLVLGQQDIRHVQLEKI